MFSKKKSKRYYSACERENKNDNYGLENKRNSILYIFIYCNLINNRI